MTTSFRHPDVVDVPGAVAAGWRNLRVAAAFLTCLPVAPGPCRRRAAPPIADVPDDPDGAFSESLYDLTRATAAFPLVGAAIGLLAAATLLASFELGLHPLTCALIALATTALLTGALHEDGLADFADGLGGRTRDGRLAIMRDSHIGSFGTLAMILAVGLRASMLSGLSSPQVAAAALVCSAAFSRAVLPAVMRYQQPARREGLAAGIGIPTIGQLGFALAFAAGICLVAFGVWPALVIMMAGGLAALAICGIAQRLLGGHTGDVLGALQVVTEIVTLATIAAME